MSLPEAQKRGGIRALFRSKLLRAAVSLIILGLLLWKLDLQLVIQTLRYVDPALLILGTLVFLAANMVSVFKWRLILKAREVSASFFYLTSLFYIGLFFNNFLLSAMGGDVVKAFKLSRHTGRAAEATGSVVVDRASSAFALLAMAIITAGLELRLLKPWMSALVVAMFVAALLLIGLVVSERAARKLSGMPLLRRDLLGMRRHARSLWFSLHSYKQHKGLMAWVMAISLAYQCLTVLTVYVLALSLGIEVPVIYYFLFIPIVLAVSMLPISLNGLGVREVAWVALFSLVNVAEAEALSMALLTFIVLTFVSLAGGVFYLFDHSVPIPDSGETYGKS
jgi:hypothetical protein